MPRSGICLGVDRCGRLRGRGLDVFPARCGPQSAERVLEVLVQHAAEHRRPDSPDRRIGGSRATEGLLALEDRLEGIRNPFIRTGVQLAIDGAKPEVVQEVLQNEIDAMAVRHKEGKALFDNFGKFAPAYGKIGTLLGLIIMLR